VETAKLEGMMPERGLSELGKLLCEDFERRIMAEKFPELGVEPMTLEEFSGRAAEISRKVDEVMESLGKATRVFQEVSTLTFRMNPVAVQRLKKAYRLIVSGWYDLPVQQQNKLSRKRRWKRLRR
jgi:hypothetical protein